MLRALDAPPVLPHVEVLGGVAQPVGAVDGRGTACASGAEALPTAWVPSTPAMEMRVHQLEAAAPSVHLTRHTPVEVAHELVAQEGLAACGQAHLRHTDGARRQHCGLHASFPAAGASLPQTAIQSLGNALTPAIPCRRTSCCSPAPQSTSGGPPASCACWCHALHSGQGRVAGW